MQRVNASLRATDERLCKAIGEGFAITRKNWTNAPGHTLELHHNGALAGEMDVAHHGTDHVVRGVFVQPQYRGQGLGKHLYESAIHHSRSMGAERLVSGHTVTNDAGKIWHGLAKMGHPIALRNNGIHSHPEYSGQFSHHDTSQRGYSLPLNKAIGDRRWYAFVYHLPIRSDSPSVYKRDKEQAMITPATKRQHEKSFNPRNATARRLFGGMLKGLRDPIPAAPRNISLFRMTFTRRAEDVVKAVDEKKVGDDLYELQTPEGAKRGHWRSVKGHKVFLTADGEVYHYSHEHSGMQLDKSPHADVSAAASDPEHLHPEEREKREEAEDKDSAELAKKTPVEPEKPDKKAPPEAHAKYESDKRDYTEKKASLKKETSARAKARKAAIKAREVDATSPHHLKEYAKTGARLVHQGAENFSTWKSRMGKHLSPQLMELLTPHLEEIHEKSLDIANKDIQDAHDKAVSGRPQTPEEFKEEYRKRYGKEVGEHFSKKRGGNIWKASMEDIEQFRDPETGKIMAMTVHGDTAGIHEYETEDGKKVQMHGGAKYGLSLDRAGHVVWSSAGEHADAALEAQAKKTHGLAIVIAGSPDTVLSSKHGSDIYENELEGLIRKRPEVAAALLSEIQDAIELFNNSEAAGKKSKPKKGEEQTVAEPKIEIPQSMPEALLALHDATFTARKILLGKLGKSENAIKFGYRGAKEIISRMVDPDFADAKSGDATSFLYFAGGGSVSAKDVNVTAHPAYPLANRGMTLGDLMNNVPLSRLAKPSFDRWKKVEGERYNRYRGMSLAEKRSHEKEMEEMSEVKASEYMAKRGFRITPPVERNWVRSLQLSKEPVELDEDFLRENLYNDKRDDQGSRPRFQAYSGRGKNARSGSDSDDDVEWGELPRFPTKYGKKSSRTGKTVPGRSRRDRVPSVGAYQQRRKEAYKKRVSGSAGILKAIGIRNLRGAIRMSALVRSHPAGF
jgi:GNAT superfamily N-acetyltransferase